MLYLYLKSYPLPTFFPIHNVLYLTPVLLISTQDFVHSYQANGACAFFYYARQLKCTHTQFLSKDMQYLQVVHFIVVFVPCFQKPSK